MIPVNTDLQVCQIEPTFNLKLNTHVSHLKSGSAVSFEYFNAEVKSNYTKMTNAVSQYVAVQVALSLLSFNPNSLETEKIAAYISAGTKPFLPFSFANGVEITDVKSKGKTVVYKTKMPLTKVHQKTAQLALEGRIATVAYVCNNTEMVADLLERHIVIQYDYFDANGDFFSSFTINGKI